MNVNDIINLVRPLVGDDAADESGQQWTDPQYLAQINMARMTMFRDHPETRLQLSGALLDYSPLDLTATIDLHDVYIPPLVSFVAWKYFESDSGDTKDLERAKENRANYELFFTPRK